MNLAEDDLIDRFLKGELSDIEARNFRERMKSDQEFAQRVAFEKQLLEVLDDKEWHQSTNPEHPEVAEYTQLFASEQAARMKEAIAASQKAYKSEGNVRRLNPWWVYSSAAMILIMVSLYFLFPRKNSPEELYISYLAKTELPSVISRGTEEVNEGLVKAQRYFDEKNYVEAADLLRKLQETNNQSSALYVYLALSQAELSSFEEATATLDELIESDLLDGEKGYWYKSLIHLKANEPEKARELLNTIVEQRYFNYELAEALLTDL